MASSISRGQTRRSSSLNNSTTTYAPGLMGAEAPPWQQKNDRSSRGTIARPVVDSTYVIRSLRFDAASSLSQPNWGQIPKRKQQIRLHEARFESALDNSGYRNSRDCSAREEWWPLFCGESVPKPSREHPC